MSRKHRGKSGEYSSGGKGCGNEYWSRRSLNGYRPSKENKRITHGIERARAKRDLQLD